jgi:hypothetical protein
VSRKNALGNPQPHALRVDQVAAKLAEHELKQRRKLKGKAHIFQRRERKRPGKLATIIAWDLETSRIRKGTPEVKYITAYCDEQNYVLSTRVNSLDHLLELLEAQFLQPRFNKCQFVAWNSNNFDVYFAALALMQCGRYVIRPYLTKSKSLRGIKVIPLEDMELKPNQQRQWEFLDGISMLGLIGVSLKEFLSKFAPEYGKHDRESFETKEFNADDPEDVAYAFRDSEGLYWGMMAAQDIIYERFNFGLRPTIGNLGIRIFESRIPEGARIIEPTYEVLRILRDYVCRGGYCHLMRRYRGKVWKYDLNQAYAAAMRECDLPMGNCYHVKGESKYCKTYIARVTATHPSNIIPFYCKQLDGMRMRSDFVTRKIADTWITKPEVDQLRNEGWTIKVIESWAWPEVFTMKDYVDSLEHMRQNASGGPKGAVGTMIKGIGNNSYGKTLEQLEPLELMLASDCPPGYVDYYGDEDPTQIPFVWCRFIETPTKKYHQPQIGAFITAHVRMVVRRAALLCPENFLYADTDCVIFDKDVTARLDINESRYGAFKLESSGEEYMLIAKKVYSSGDFKTKHSKGLNVKRLEFADFVEWFAGNAPVQQQVQRQNFVKVLRGADMFIDRQRKGTKIS